MQKLRGCDLYIVGWDDSQVRDDNRGAFQLLRSTRCNTVEVDSYRLEFVAGTQGEGSPMRRDEGGFGSDGIIGEGTIQQLPIDERIPPLKRKM
jgi:hypothetical protein